MIGKKLTPFKFWCQKVLPTVYDDSLSYYEYLGKLNEYLNEVIEQINTLTQAEEDFQEDLSQQWEDYKSGLNDDWLEYKSGLTEEWNTYQRELTEAWLETKGYIDHYFDNLNVQTEINNKLDAMVLDGTMSNLIEGVISDDIPTTVTAWLTEHVDPVGSAVVVDDTLSITGAAADAKVTGDEFISIKDGLLKSKTNDEEPLDATGWPTNIATVVSYIDKMSGDNTMPFFPAQKEYIGWYPTVDLVATYRYFNLSIPSSLQNKSFNVGFWVKDELTPTRSFRMWVLSSAPDDTLQVTLNSLPVGSTASTDSVTYVIDQKINDWAHFTITVDGTSATHSAIYIGSHFQLASEKLKVSIPVIIQGTLKWFMNYDNKYYNEEIISEDPLHGKSINWIGDSIFYGGGNSYNNGWIGRIADKHGCTYETLAANGAMIIDPQNASYYSIALKCTDFVNINPDYIIFEGGVNDFFNPSLSPLGTYNPDRYDTPNDKTTSFSSAFEYCIYQMITAYPNAKIGYVVPYKMVSYNSNINVYDISGKAYFDRAVEICKKWGVPVLDMREQCDLNYQISALQSKFTDHVHINTDGYDYSYNVIGEWLKTL